MQIEAMRAVKNLALVLAAALWVMALPMVQAWAQSDQPIRVVALGDSLTAGYGLATNKAFPVQLQAALQNAGVPAIVENAGVSGDTTAGGLARLEWSLGAENPDLTIVALGGNDFLRGLPIGSTQSNMETIVGGLAERDVPTLVAGMLAPPSMGQDYEKTFNAIYPAVAEANDAFLYPFFLEGVAFERALNQPDGIHPTAQGVGIIVERMLPSVINALVESGACGPAENAVCDAAAFDLAEQGRT
ncbi:MAG: arylesterase [Pseudomonadota bacterium]